ncbi:hypothetical protein F383_28403 [Gossypium arboreum]|uniref:Uncharacterized protein n=1 Tax=Gossypium arboreum TaxID=29729 RepID=A0A0B0MU81_GOSAR|nr:hypothetical protein F383_28403 [Gossypium arboreum]
MDLGSFQNIKDLKELF